MSRCLNRVAEVLGLAESKKVTDRKTFVKDLQDIYFNDEYIKAINDRTSKDFSSATSWNQIMLTIHNVLLAEMGKPVGKTAKGCTTIPVQSGCCDLMTRTVKLAITSPKMYLNCADLMAIIFQILGKQIYEICHDTYIGILKNILTHKVYRLAISPDQWQAILKFSLKIYRNSSQAIKSVVLEIARIAVQYGSLQSHLLSSVKKILPFLETIYQEIASGIEMSKKPVYKLTYTVCQQLGSECRIALCEFGEKILPSIVTIEGCPEKYNMMLLLIQIHHPGGASTDQDGAYARDWEKWRNIMRGIYASIVRSTKTEILSPCFLKLACEVYRQIMSDPSYSTDDALSCSLQEMQPRKRRRLSFAVRKPIDMLIDNDLEATWPSIQILTVLLEKYPNTLISSDYVEFLKTVTAFVTASLNNEKTMDSLCELCTVLVAVEKEHYREAEQAENVGICWEKIWDTIFRALSMNQNEILGHALLQSIIQHRSTPNPNGFLRLYLSNAIRWSSSSVKTLLTYCEYTPIPDDFVNAGSTNLSKPEGSTRISLLKWALELPASEQFPRALVVDLANLLTALVVRYWYEREYRDWRRIQDSEQQRKIESYVKLKKDLFDDREGRFHEDIERCNLSLNFQFKETDEVEEPRKNNEIKARIFHVQESLDFLILRLKHLIGDRVTIDNLENVTKNLAVIGKLASNLIELNIRFDVRVKTLLELFAKCFKEIVSQIVTISDTTKCFNLVNIIETLETLYATRYDRDVAAILIESSAINYLEYIYNLLSEDEEDSVDDDDENARSFNNLHGKRARKGTEICSTVNNKLSETCRLNNSAYKILTCFCYARIDDKMTDAQKRVLKNLMKIDVYVATSNADLRRALNVLQMHGMSDKLMETSQESLEMAINFIRQLFDSRMKDETAARGILHMIPRFIRASMANPDETGKLLEILSTINKRLMKKKYGPFVNEDFVKCVAEIIRSDPSLTWKPTKFAENSPLLDVLIGYVNNPFYLVRLEVSRALRVVFASKSLRVPSKVDFFDKIESTIPELFSTEEDLSECEKLDEAQTRTVTAVQIYATIISANEFFCPRALYSMIKLSVNRDVKVSTLKKALLHVTKTEEKQRLLIESNLHYLLSRWFEADHPLEWFPWILAHCDSLEDFSRSHIATLLAIKLQRCEFKHLPILCTNLEVSFEKTIEDSFPTIMTLLMSMIVENFSDTENSKVVMYARQMYERLRYNKDEFRAVETFDTLLKKKLSDVVTNLVERLRDDEHFNRTFSRRVYLPSINPPNFTAETIDQCFVFLEKVLPVEKKSLVEYFVTRRPNVLQRVSEKLFCNITDVDCQDHKLQAFHQYRYFGTMILQELQKPCFDPMALYIVRDTCYSLISLTKDESLAEMACDYMYDFIKGSMPGRADEMKEVLSFVVSTLVPIVQASSIRGAMRVLNLLIIDFTELLNDAIKKLDSFPSVESFEAIKRVHNGLKYAVARNYSLEDEIEHFLNATNVKTLSCSHEGLLHVKNQLSTRKDELHEMYRRLEGLRGFAEDCASSTLHKLIYKLVQLTRSPDLDISLEAAKCLGELGPADLTTMILHPDNLHVKEDNDEILMLTFRVISQLVDYLVDNNTSLRRASSSALYVIFATPWASDLKRQTTWNDLTCVYKIDNPNICHYIYPFVDRASAKKPGTVHVDRGNWQRLLRRDNGLWTPANYESYDRWIIDITCNILDCFVNLYAAILKPVCRESVEFCENLLPRLVNLVQSIDRQLVNDVCVCINNFFSRVYEALGETDATMTMPDSPVKRDVTLSHQCVRCMINVVNFIRIQSSDNAPIGFDYLYIAKAAQYCSAYFTSVLYAELWSQSLLEDSRLLQDKVPGSWISAIDCICESNPEPGKLLQSILREAYLHIGDPDSIYGCGLSHLVDSSHRIQHYVHSRQWDKVLLAHDVELSSGNSSTRGILNALKQSGLQSLFGRVISTVNREQENVDDFLYEAAWRLADWSIIQPPRSHDDFHHSRKLDGHHSYDNDYHSAHYHALKSLRESDSLGLKTFLDHARTSLVALLRKISLECSQTVYPILSQLQMLREIEDFSTIEGDNDGRVFHDWRDNNSLSNHDFQWVEAILSQRLVMFRSTEHLGSITNRSLIETHLDIAEIAREQGYLPIAARALDTLSRQNLPDAARDEVTYQEGFLAWKRNDQDIARCLVRDLIKKSNLSPNLRAKALRVYGNWMSVMKSENPQAIIEKYYQESIITSNSIEYKSAGDMKNLTAAQADLAQFADAQYQQINEFMQSPQYENLLECTKLKNDESRSSSAKGKDEQRAIMTYQKQVTNDAAELENIKKEKAMFLVLAVKYYLKTLQTGDEHDLLVFRLVSLWLDNPLNPKLNDILHRQLNSVASYKFIVLLPQLAPHMSNEIDVFTTKINDLVERCALEHPHHTLPVLLALMNTHKDHQFKPPEKGTQRRNESVRPEARVLAAEALIAKLSSSPIRPIIREMNDLSHALVALAYQSVNEPQARKKDVARVIPRNQPIMKIRNYTNVSVPTVTIAVRPGGNYNDIVGVREYAANFDLPGGVNAPKKVICIGTDGIRRKQLVKGQDDLRQDAVMQQVCTVMNDMLRTSKETKKRKLHIRTYKIVPLSQRSGILEWCENTLPISNVLCDTGGVPGMHTKYYPDDWSATKCRLKLQAVDRSPMDVKLEAFLECCKNLHPAFHHFFMEKYQSAETWFERRLAYVRSVATTSMVGYMLGLGDRHFSNILIDQTTAEVIHIDFGIAFAQGKVLPIPETVPFRLTRDMEVAMGICGVEGVMRRSCEETVAVLRDRRKILITLLQVLLYDPLFSWAITPVKTDHLENHCTRRYSGRVDEDREVKKTNKLAERALLRIEQKLQGTEDGISSSISGQVERLIQQARDPVNLCRLYSGWQAYL